MSWLGVRAVMGFLGGMWMGVSVIVNYACNSSCLFQEWFPRCGPLLVDIVADGILLGCSLL